MIRLNSSTSSSDGSRSRRITSVLVLFGWVAIGLAIIDLAINFLFAYPSDPRNTAPSKLQSYFEYGRSTEGQLLRMTRKDPKETAPITLPGWYETMEVTEFPPKAPDSIVTIYGMSHAVRLGLALHRVSKRYTPRILGAPGAPTNWSYGAFLRDRGGHKSTAVVLAFMSHNFGIMSSLSAMTWAYDLPMPYTSDRFYLEGGELRTLHPPYATFEAYADALYDPDRWEQVREFFAANDPMYNAAFFRANFLDHSSIFRMLRRSYEQRYLRATRQSGFDPDSESIKVAHAIIHNFAAEARQAGMIPIIYIVNNFGFSDYLYRALAPALRADSVPYLSSHTVVSPDDPRGYLRDSHFTEEVDDRLAEALENVVDQARANASERTAPSSGK
jgi:hypothetical protein